MMNLRQKYSTMRVAVVLACTFLLAAAVPVSAQNYPPAYGPAQLDNLVSRIALYPDPLLAQVLAASTYADQIPDAAAWADRYRDYNGDALADVMERENLPWDPSVQSLIPFPTVLDTMAQDMNWTEDLGNAVLAQRPEVMDAVQRMRASAVRYGYLRNTPQIRVVGSGGWYEIVPVNPDYIYVPVYDPYVVYAPPRAGFVVGGAIRFAHGFTLGVSFGRWGWGGGFNWRSHAIMVNHNPWQRTWVNRRTYVHNYQRWDGGRAHRPGVGNEHVTVQREVNVQKDVHRDVRRDNDRDRNSFNRPAPAPAPAPRNVDRGREAFRPAPNRTPAPTVQRAQPQRSNTVRGSDNGGRGRQVSEGRNKPEAHKDSGNKDRGKDHGDKGKEKERR